MITKKSKVNTIVSAFLSTIRGIDENMDVPEKELDNRRLSCDGCPYNSKNVPDDKKSLYNTARNTTLGTFCTICNCNIKEKTLSPNEQCALVEKGRKPLWNRLAVLTEGKTVDLINLSPDKINIDADKNNYLIYTDVILLDLNFKFGIRTKEIIENILYVRSTCPCIKVNDFTSSDTMIEVNATIKAGTIKQGLFSKFLYVSYTSTQGETVRLGIQLKGQKA